jgi:hypothetical protein
MKETLRKIMNAIDNSELKGAKSTLTELEGVIEHILKVSVKPDGVTDPRGRSRHAAANLAEALETYRVRNKLYGNNYKRFGAVMAALYPDAGSANCVNMTADQWNRLGVIVQIVSKLTRYVANPAVGHLDSIHDAGVYCFILEELDAELQGYYVNSPDAPAQQINIQESCEHVWKTDASKNQMFCLGCGATRSIV